MDDNITILSAKVDLLLDLMKQSLEQGERVEMKVADMDKRIQAVENWILKSMSAEVSRRKPPEEDGESDGGLEFDEEWLRTPTSRKPGEKKDAMPPRGFNSQKVDRDIPMENVNSNSNWRGTASDKDDIQEIHNPPSAGARNVPFTRSSVEQGESSTNERAEEDEDGTDLPKRRCDSRGDFRCGICSRTFTFAPALTEHIQEHFEEKKANKTAKTSSSGPSRLNGPKAKPANKKRKRPSKPLVNTVRYPCGYCPKTFCEDRHRRKHEIQYHRTERTAAGHPPDGMLVGHSVFG